MVLTGPADSANEHPTPTYGAAPDHSDYRKYDPIAEFAERYDDLVDLLCWTAKEGVTDGSQKEYSDLRDWFLRSYESVRPNLLTQLVEEEDDRIILAGMDRVARDAFETLFLPPHVGAVIHSEAVILRIMRTRIAVEACRRGLAPVYA
jgi:hypothetical protein